jgi:ssDNA-binding Zn-finger/Zn-ribbon topoisomerase 1
MTEVGTATTATEEVLKVLKEINSNLERIADSLESKRPAEKGASHRKKELKRQAPICPECDTQMVNRRGKYGQFYGCPNYPNCLVTCNMDDHGNPIGIPSERTKPKSYEDDHLRGDDYIDCPDVDDIPF